MKQHLYISSFLVILFVSLVLLNNYSIPCPGCSSNKQYLEIQKFNTEKWSLKDVTENNPWDTGDQSAKITLFEETPVQKDMNLTALFIDKLLSNPTLIDLPPPALQI